ncbi:MAG: Hpt domain-containing protein [Acidobacteria bacterium]|nr:Hpt domain-containing protein [Acidobacteriota bacterium]
MNQLSEQAQLRVADIRRRFIENLPELIQQLKSDAQKGDAESIERLQGTAHRLVGSAGTFGLKAVSTAGMELERRIRACASEHDTLKAIGVLEQALNTDMSNLPGVSSDK